METRNATLTVRMLVLLESACLVNDETYRQGLAAIRDVYLRKGGPKDHRPPRFLLNDVDRYWRTICVDYEGKVRNRAGEGWALRNAKLRTVRKMLYAGGLLPLLRCAELHRDEIGGFLERQFRRPPAARVADALLSYNLGDHGAEAPYSTTDSGSCSSIRLFLMQPAGSGSFDSHRVFRGYSPRPGARTRRRCARGA